MLRQSWLVLVRRPGRGARAGHAPWVTPVLDEGPPLREGPSSTCCSPLHFPTGSPQGMMCRTGIRADCPARGGCGPPGPASAQGLARTQTTRLPAAGYAAKLLDVPQLLSEAPRHCGMVPVPGPADPGRSRHRSGVGADDVQDDLADRLLRQRLPDVRLDLRGGYDLE